jgi:hypothetical protein
MNFRKIAIAALKIASVGIALNEIRGLIMAGPVLYALYQSGGTLMAIWMAICAFGGIALSVLVPLWAARKFEKRLEKIA